MHVGRFEAVGRLEAVEITEVERVVSVERIEDERVVAVEAVGRTAVERIEAVEAVEGIKFGIAEAFPVGHARPWETSCRRRTDVGTKDKNIFQERSTSK